MPEADVMCEGHEKAFQLYYVTFEKGSKNPFLGPETGQRGKEWVEKKMGKCVPWCPVLNRHNCVIFL